MLARETDVDGKVKTYDYDSQGRRLGQALKASSNLQAEFRPYATDANGSVTGLEDPSNGAVGDDTYLYDPYGASEKVVFVPQGAPTPPDDYGLSSRAQDNPFRFEGFYYDAGVKSYDMLAREYKPDFGHFLSQDRFEAAIADDFLQADPLTQNRYAFAGGNPVNNVEFDGHSPLGGRPRLPSGGGSHHGSSHHSGGGRSGGGLNVGAFVRRAVAVANRGASVLRSVATRTAASSPTSLPTSFRSDAASRNYHIFGGAPGPPNPQPGQCRALSRGGTCDRVSMGGNFQVEGGELRDPAMFWFIVTLPIGGVGGGAARGARAAPGIISVVRGIVAGSGGGAKVGLGARAFKFGDLPAGVLGKTDWEGNITIARGLSGRQLEETLRHETVHSVLTPKRGPFVGARRELRALAYKRSALARYAEEALAQTYATRSLAKGLAFPVKAGYVPAWRIGVEGGTLGLGAYAATR